MSKSSFNEQVFQVREGAIVAAVNKLLARKGFDAMTVDEVAAEVGVAKTSLYKHFRSKEELAAAALVALLNEAIAFVSQCQAAGDTDPLGQLRKVVAWAVRKQLAGDMPALPSQNSALRKTLVAHTVYMDRLMALTDLLGGWIEAASKRGDLDASLPPAMVLYTLFAKGCDPVVGLLQASGQHTDDQIVEWAVRSCFNGLAAAKPSPDPKPNPKLTPEPKPTSNPKRSAR